MRLRDVGFQSDNSRAQRGQVGASDTDYDSLILSFSVTGSYDTFRAFVESLEQSLRLVDIQSISFSATDTGVYDYSIAVKTYWLKP